MAPPINFIRISTVDIEPPGGENMRLTPNSGILPRAGEPQGS